MAAPKGPPYDFNLLQQYYCLSFVSNAAGRSAGTSEKLQGILQSALEQGLPQIGGSWSIAWGPSVYKPYPLSSEGGPVNACFVAVDNTQKQCIVSIAGTALSSLRAWFGDADVLAVVDFGNWSSQWNTANVPAFQRTVHHPGDVRSLASRGTCKFTCNVLNTAPPSNAAAAGIPLAAFLQGFQTKNPDHSIVFAGHSMGGAVAPTVALGLVQSNILKTSNISVLASAGDTPGNDVFAAQFAATFPAIPNYNTILYNTLDIVPQAWSVNQMDDRNLSRLKTIYGSATESMQRVISDLVSAAEIDAEIGMPYKPLPGNAFTGSPSISPGISSMKELEMSVGTQHGDAYWTQLGIIDYVHWFKENVIHVPVDEVPSSETVDDDIAFLSEYARAKDKSAR